MEIIVNLPAPYWIYEIPKLREVVHTSLNKLTNIKIELNTLPVSSKLEIDSHTNTIELINKGIELLLEIGLILETPQKEYRRIEIPKEISPLTSKLSEIEKEIEDLFS